MNINRQRRQLLQHLQVGQFDAAGLNIAAWLAFAPGAFEPQFMRVQYFLQRGELRAAHDEAIRLLRSQACPAEFAVEALNCLNSFAAQDAMIEFATKFTHRADLPARDLAEAAVTLSRVGAHSLALVWADDAARLAPNDAVCLVNRALILNYLGKFEHARDDLLKVIRETNHSAMAFWLLARLERQTPESNHVLAIQAANNQKNLHPGDRAFLGYALFKELDDLGEHARAWEALQAGATFACQQSTYQANNEAQKFAAIKHIFSSEATASIRPSVLNESDASKTPIFILGMHRSGTSLIERILASSPDVFDFGESQRLDAAIRYAANWFAPEVPDVELLRRSATMDYSALAKVYLNLGAQQSKGKRFTTEKTPRNFLNIGFILRALPNAKIIHMRREPIDLCFANFRELFGSGVSHVYAFADLVHYHRLYLDLMRHWHQLYPAQILDVQYENLVQNPQVEAQQVFEFCGIDWSVDYLDLVSRADAPVATLSSVQVRQPINAASVGKWRPYTPWLAELITAFAPEVIPGTDAV